MHIYTSVPHPPTPPPPHPPTPPHTHSHTTPHAGVFWRLLLRALCSSRQGWGAPGRCDGPPLWGLNALGPEHKQNAGTGERGCDICRVGQNQRYTVCIWCFWQGHLQIYSRIRCIYIRFWPTLCIRAYVEHHLFNGHMACQQ